MKVFTQSFIFFIVLVPITLHAQTQTKAGNTYTTVTALPIGELETRNNDEQVITPYDGTYRFIFTKRVKQVFTDEIFSVIDKNRKESEEVTIVLSEYSKLQIFSRKQIQAPDFTPLTKSYIFEQE